MRNKRFIFYLSGVLITTIVLIVYLQYNSDRNIKDLIHGNESLINEFQIIGEIQKLETDLLYIETQVHRTVIEGDSGYLAGIWQKEMNVKASLSRLRPQLLTESTRGSIHQLDSLIEDKLQFSNSVLTALFTKGRPAAEKIIKSRKGKYVMIKIVNLIDSLISPRRLYLTQLALDVTRSGHSAREWGNILAITAALACIFTFWYITHRIKRHQEMFNQLNESEKRVRQAGILKENFMANMSHEIRTPMNAILGFTNLLQKEKLDLNSREFVDSIQNSAESLLAIIDDILDFSKIEAGMMRIESNPFSLRGLLHSVQTMFTTRIQQNNIQLTVAVEKSIPDVLEGDAVRLTQIMVNLVNNSVKFTSSGSIKINVTAGNEKEDSIELSFSVKDTGIGIQPDKMDAIFERFQQADEDTTRKYGGTGLGLSIVKQLVDLLNGTIRVSSEQNVGTEFVFTLPFIIPKELKEEVSQKVAEDHEIQLTKNNIKILVAEDNAMNQSLMKHLLAGRKFDFDIVNNGKEAIEALQQIKYDVVLMDIQMPQMDGYTAMLKIRNELKINTPVIAMTAHAMAGERKKCLSYGMNEYIPKPIHENELFKIINNIIAGHTGDMLNLAYLKEISGGNTAFEVNMMEQFLQQVPGELAALQNAFNKENYLDLAQIAHNIKTSVSFVGLTNKLGPYLDYIETNAGVQEQDTHLQETIRLVNEICSQAFREAKEYLGL